MNQTQKKNSHLYDNIPFNLIVTVFLLIMNQTEKKVTYTTTFLSTWSESQIDYSECTRHDAMGQENPDKQYTPRP